MLIQSGTSNIHPQPSAVTAEIFSFFGAVSPYHLLNHILLATLLLPLLLAASRALFREAFQEASFFWNNYLIIINSMMPLLEIWYSVMVRIWSDQRGKSQAWVDSRHTRDRQYTWGILLGLRLELHPLLNYVTLSKSFNYSQLKYHHLREALLDHPLSKWLLWLVTLYYYFPICIFHSTITFCNWMLICFLLYVFPNGL